jgi:hypothetical protein
MMHHAAEFTRAVKKSLRFIRSSFSGFHGNPENLNSWSKQSYNIANRYFIVHLFLIPAFRQSLSITRVLRRHVLPEVSLPIRFARFCLFRLRNALSFSSQCSAIISIIAFGTLAESRYFDICSAVKLWWDISDTSLSTARCARN